MQESSESLTNRVWGDTSSEGTMMARIFSNSMNGALYCDILATELKTSMANFRKGTDYMFHQDVASWHTSKLVQEKMVK